MRAQSGVRPEVVLVPWGSWRSTPPDDSSPAEESLAAARRAGLALTRAPHVRFIEATDTTPAECHRSPARQTAAIRGSHRSRRLRAHRRDLARPRPSARSRGGAGPRRPAVPGQRRGPRGPRLRAGPRPLGGRDAGRTRRRHDPGRRPPRPPPRARAAVRAPAAAGRRGPRAGRRRRGHDRQARRGADAGLGRRPARPAAPLAGRGRGVLRRRDLVGPASYDATNCSTSPTRPPSASRPDCRPGWWPRTDATT